MTDEISRIIKKNTLLTAVTLKKTLLSKSKCVIMDVWWWWWGVCVYVCVFVFQRYVSPADV